jgi:hypothetical protein
MLSFPALIAVILIEVISKVTPELLQLSKAAPALANLCATFSAMFSLKADVPPVSSSGSVWSELLPAVSVQCSSTAVAPPVETSALAKTTQLPGRRYPRDRRVAASIARGPGGGVLGSPSLGAAEFSATAGTALDERRTAATCQLCSPQVRPAPPLAIIPSSITHTLTGTAGHRLPERVARERHMLIGPVGACPVPRNKQ